MDDRVLTLRVQKIIADKYLSILEESLPSTQSANKMINNRTDGEVINLCRDWGINHGRARKLAKTHYLSRFQAQQR